ncbi:CBS domain-containing protein [Mesonia sp. K4-1]|jgi:predicted transcriptional regulator|uniref:CBS domain-containing protein n=1 Tax=Mesonia sp. K4-1 TaxID=2602760 RepID=UPI0011C76338|nr:CBS domain-containing protein [Mesonia sp. K4-1]TXK75715.1 CBS domain-containing protein [Mesonia sp. K4-1]
MLLSNYIIKDIEIQSVNQPIKNLKKLFNELTYTHIPVEKDGVFIGSISENDLRCFDNEKTLEDYQYALERFFVRDTENWLEVLKNFSVNNANLMPVLEDKSNKYLGYLELGDIMSFFNETPFLNESGAILVVEKNFTEYSFSEISQIIESSNNKLLGAFVSKIENDVAEITIKTNISGVNDVIQTLRRYGYNILSSHEEDTYTKNLQERSDYLDKYLNI